MTTRLQHQRTSTTPGVKTPRRRLRPEAGNSLRGDFAVIATVAVAAVAVEDGRSRWLSPLRLRKRPRCRPLEAQLARRPKPIQLRN